MKKSVIAAVFGSALLASQCYASISSIDLEVYDAFKTVAVGQDTLVTFGGKITIADGYRFSSLGVEFPGLTISGPYLNDLTWSQSLIDYQTAEVYGLDYEGDFFSILVHSTDAAGNYLYNPTGWGYDATLCEIVGTSTNLQINEIDAQTFGITVKELGEPNVPGPAAVIPMAIGLAGVALKRRRNR